MRIYLTEIGEIEQALNSKKDIFYFNEEYSIKKDVMGVIMIYGNFSGEKFPLLDKDGFDKKIDVKKIYIHSPIEKAAENLNNFLENFKKTQLELEELVKNLRDREEAKKDMAWGFQEHDKRSLFSLNKKINNLKKMITEIQKNLKEIK